MATKKTRYLLGICILLTFLIVIPTAQSQIGYQSYFWSPRQSGHQLSEILFTADLNNDHIQVSNPVCTQKNIRKHFCNNRLVLRLYINQKNRPLG